MTVKRLFPIGRQSGFTLVELVIVIVLMGILAGSFMMFFKPTIDGYFDARRRADLTDIADTALRRMMQEIKGAVPNSVNLISSQCVQFIPAMGGGRYRVGLDYSNDVGPPTCSSPNCSTYPDEKASASAATTFDVLTLLGTAPSKNDFVVINNQNSDDVYGASPIGRYTVSATPTTPLTRLGTHRIVINGNPAASGYVGGRFQVVNQSVPSVMYSCSGSRLYRTVMTTTKETACQTSGDVLATDVASCTFGDPSIPTYLPMFGYLPLTLQLTRSGESVVLSYGVHVENAQ